MKAKRLKKNRRGFSLVELVVAIAVMSIISATLSMILGNTLNLYSKGESASVLYNVSQKIHDALNRELVSAGSIVLYESESADSMVNNDYQARLYLSDGRLVKVYQEDKEKKTSEILLSQDSYRGCEIQSFTMKYDSVDERYNYSDSTTRRCYRILYITTTISLNGQKYEQTSTVRLYSLSLAEVPSEINIKVKNNEDIITADENHKKTEFTTCIYYYSQYFNPV